MSPDRQTSHRNETCQGSSQELRLKISGAPVPREAWLQHSLAEARMRPRFINYCREKWESPPLDTSQQTFLEGLFSKLGPYPLLKLSLSSGTQYPSKGGGRKGALRTLETFKEHVLAQS